MTFDFEKHGLSVLTGSLVENKTDNPLLVENPLEPALNVSRNVVKTELEAFQKHCHSSLNLLEDGFKLRDLLRAELNNGSQVPEIKLDELFRMDESESDIKTESGATVSAEQAVGTATAEGN